MQDLTGKRFGKLTVLKYHHKVKRNDGKHYLHYYLCKCDCGNETIVCLTHLKNEHTKSCGCIRYEPNRAIHNLRKHRIYKIWAGIKTRCLNKNSIAYKDYGARGISICKEWESNILPFYNWAIANGYNDNLSIERIDVNGNYEPSNCKWIPKPEQSKNRRSNHLITYNNETHTIADWATNLNINYGKLYLRLKRYKWSIDKAFNTP